LTLGDVSGHAQQCSTTCYGCPVRRVWKQEAGDVSCAHPGNGRRGGSVAQIVE
jgi:hypothetical protein